MKSSPRKSSSSCYLTREGFTGVPISNVVGIEMQ
jgi:hypothetical protein